MGDNNQQLPKYLSLDFFKKSLGLEVTLFEAKPAVAKGDNYTSALYRVLLHTKNKEIKSVIIKCSFEEGKMKEMLEKSGVFDIESRAIGFVVPKARKLLTEIGVDTKLSPDLLYYRSESPPCIILEDLKESGYKLADRVQGLDLEHCKLVLSKLAKLHATGKILYDQDASNLKTFTNCVYNESNEDFNMFCTSCVEATANQTRTWGGEYLQIAEKLDKIKGKVLVNLKPMYRKDCPFVVFNHGDFWVNNMMFRYKEGKVEDVVLVDFQCCFYGSPANDILYFLHGSCNEEVFWNHRNELIQFYYDNLKQTLISLQYDGYIPTIQDLERELDICSFIAVYTVTCVKPIMMNESIEEADDIMDEMNEDGSHKNSMLRKYSNPKLIQVLKKRLKFLDSQGQLD